jgi:hypothetical protein
MTLKLPCTLSRYDIDGPTITEKIAAIYHTPVKKRTEKQFLKVLNTYNSGNPRGYNAFYYLPEHLDSDELHELAEKWAYRTRGESLQAVPLRFFTDEFCKFCEDFLFSYPLALEYIPNVRTTLQMCRVAMCKDIKALEFVPATFRAEIEEIFKDKIKAHKDQELMDRLNKWFNNYPG